MFRTSSFAIALGAAMLAPATVSAATIIVDANANSSTNDGGTAVGKASGLILAIGEGFRIRSSTDDLWSAGALPRFSDANGLTGPRFATATDDSGQGIGTQIGQDFGLWTQAGFSAPYGSLVGRYADGTFQLLGANFTGVATGAGALDLYYWDSNSGDNFGDISFTVVAGIPEPATWAMMIMGFGLAGGVLRQTKRRRAVQVHFA